MMSEAESSQEEITAAGNPSQPQGEAGAKMLARMNESHAEVTNWALGFFDWNGTEQVLDIGCGGGAALKRMAEMLGPRGRLTGLDYSEVSVAESRRLNADAVRDGRMKIIAGSVEHLPFAGDSFDKITTVESFYFWPDPQENLREVRRVLRPGGVFLLVADIHDHEGMSEAARENIARYHMFNPTLDGYRELLETAGFRQVRIHTKPGEEWVCAEGRK